MHHIQYLSDRDKFKKMQRIIKCAVAYAEMCEDMRIFTYFCVYEFGNGKVCSMQMFAKCVICVLRLCCCDHMITVNQWYADRHSIKNEISA